MSQSFTVQQAVETSRIWKPSFWVELSERSWRKDKNLALAAPFLPSWVGALGQFSTKVSFFALRLLNWVLNRPETEKGKNTPSAKLFPSLEP